MVDSNRTHNKKLIHLRVTSRKIDRFFICENTMGKFDQKAAASATSSVSGQELEESILRVLSQDSEMLDISE